MAFERVAFAPSFSDFAVLKSFLEKEGLLVSDFSQSGHVTIAGADQGFYVKVPPPQANQARKLLERQSFGHFVVAEA